MIGYGRFGSLAARYLSREAVVLVHDPRRSPIPRRSRRLRRATLVEAASQPVVILAVPISSLQAVLRSIRPHLSHGALVVDVCAVKAAPARWMKRLLPRTVRILGTHPFFGPASAQRSLAGKTIVLCPVRIPRSHLEQIRRLLVRKGLRPIVMSVGEHDVLAAETVFLTQFTGRVLMRAGVRRRPEVTDTYGALLSLIDVARKDTPQLSADMARFSPHARRVLRRLKAAQSWAVRRIIRS